MGPLPLTDNIQNDAKKENKVNFKISKYNFMYLQ